MAWTTPRTWHDGETVTADWFNTYIRDNMNVLKTQIDDSGLLAVIYEQAVTGVTNSGSTETDLWSWTLPANTLEAAGDAIYFRAVGLLAQNANSKTIKVYIATSSAVLITTTENVTPNFLAIHGVLVRVSQTTATVDATVIHGAYPVGISLTVSAWVSGGAIDFATDQTIRITGQGTATNDVTLYRPLAIIVKD